MIGKARQIYEFGPYRLDVAERILLRDGEPVTLKPKVFDLLAVLAENHGHLMEKDALLKTLWPDSFVEEANLNVNISALRRALGELPTESQFIETVPRRGYRFVAEVTEVSVEDVRKLGELSISETSAINQTVESESAGSLDIRTTLSSVVQDRLTEVTGRRSTRAMFLSMIILVVMVAVSIVVWRFSNRRVVGPTAIRTLAVLPFRPLTGSESDAALEVGMADALITRLSNAKEISVRPTSSVIRYSGADANPITAGRELQVDAVLEGRVQRDGNRIRVTVQLLRVTDGVPIWADTFNDYFTNIFAVQDSISEKMADALAMRLSGSERQLLTKRYTENTDAYQLYNQGRYFHFKYQFDKAMAFFQAAIAEDPDYALAYAGLAMNYVTAGVQNPDQKEYRDKAMEAANKALSLDVNLGEAHNALGWLKYLIDWDWSGAQQELQRAIQLNPSESQPHINYASVLSSLGRHEEALKESETALRLDPMSSDVNFNYSLHLYQARRYDQAAAVARKAIEIDSDHPLLGSLLSRIYLAQSLFDEAIAAIEQQPPPNAARGSASLAYAYARKGRRTEAEEILKEMLSKTRGAHSNGSIALVYLGLNDKDHALEYLEKAFQERENIVIHLKVEPLFDPLHSDPRFLDLQRRMRLE